MKKNCTWKESKYLPKVNIQYLLNDEIFKVKLEILAKYYVEQCSMCSGSEKWVHPWHNVKYLCTSAAMRSCTLMTLDERTVRHHPRCTMAGSRDQPYDCRRVFCHQSNVPPTADEIPYTTDIMTPRPSTCWVLQIQSFLPPCLFPVI